MKKFLIVLGALLLLGVIVFILGPKLDYPDFDNEIGAIDVKLEELDDLIAEQESKVKNMKPDNQSRIIWYDSVKTKTPYSVVYLHGFSASQEEGDPLHTDFAERYGCNLYLPRLIGHGIDDDNSFVDLTPGALVESAKEAIQIGKLLGDKVIIMSGSTGGTLAAYLASGNDDIHSLITYSPNIDLYDTSSDIILYPWGVQLSKASVGGEQLKFRYDDLQSKYWNPVYHLNGVMVIKYLCKKTMTKEVFSQIDQPLFLGYYYIDDDHCDQVVSVPRMLDFYEQVSTPEGKKRKKAFTTVKRHVLTSHVFDEDLSPVFEETYKFAEEILNLKPVEKEETVF